jgi:Tol biopolymer transport system component
MFAPRPVPGRLLHGLALVLLAGCSTDRPTEPAAGPPPPTTGLAARAIAVRVDIAAGTVTVLDRSAATARDGLSFALLGANEISATTSNFFRSAVGQFVAKKVRIKFDVAIKNRSSVNLLPPTFPTPPAGTQSVMLFPFSTTLTGGNGAIDASSDWDGAVMNFFNDASCSSGGKSDCYRWEGFPAPFASGTTTAARTVGFDVDPTVQSFTTYFVLAADLTVPGSISGTVTSPQRGPLGHVAVSLTPANRFTGTENTGAYGFDNLTAGAYTVTLSGLPGYCFPVASKSANVTSGANTIVDFSVDCPHIAFTSRRAGGPELEIWRMNADGTGLTQLTTTAVGVSPWEPAWSPDRSKIAFVGGDGDIYTMNPDGSGALNISNSGQEYEPNWSFDGGRIVFTSARDDNTTGLAAEIWVMNADGSGQTRISNDIYEDRDGAWSPDGSKIVYSRDYARYADFDDPRRFLQILVMNPDGSGQAPLTELTSNNGKPAWSPDGTKIAFESDRGGHREVYVMNADGSSPVKLTTAPAGGFSGDPAWSSDGQRIAFTQASGPPVQGFSPTDIWVMNADGSSPVQLMNDPVGDIQPTWEP